MSGPDDDVDGPFADPPPPSWPAVLALLVLVGAVVVLVLGLSYLGMAP